VDFPASFFTWTARTMATMSNIYSGTPVLTVEREVTSNGNLIRATWATMKLMHGQLPVPDTTRYKLPTA
jgi:hypothetical protein